MRSGGAEPLLLDLLTMSDRAGPRAVLVGAVLVSALMLVVVACTNGSSNDTSRRDAIGPSTSGIDPTSTTCVVRTDLLVFVNPAATPATVDSIETGLKETPGVISVSYVDQEGAYDEFRRLFADRPDLLEGVTPDVLPTSFRVTLDDPSHAQDVMTVVQTLDGVGQVLEPDAPTDPDAVC